jgi:hypothetical protein
VTDIDPIGPVESPNWTKVVQRKRREEDEPGRQHKAFEEELPDEEPPEDEEGHQHIDIRV